MDFKIEIHIANHNVALYLFPTGKDIPENVQVCLFHPTDTAKNRTKLISHTFDEANGTAV